MKNILFILAFIATTFTVQAQVNGSIQKIDADEVPAAVIASQASNFPAATVTVWEKQSATGRKRSGERYVASFNNNGQAARAKYAKNGIGSTAITFYDGEQLPAVIQEAAATNYDGYTLNSGEQIQVLSTKDIFYRLRLRKGAQKLVVYVDATGNEVSKEEVTEEVEEA